MAEATVLDEGTFSFTIESRLLRELGERLVKQPEVAIVELVKNAYDADATECEIVYDRGVSITVKDDGVGMTLARFKSGWMRIGTSAKEETPVSERYQRRITGEKGIGRFAVRFLGRSLHLESVANDPDRGHRTRLTADFDWLTFDEHEDLGQIRVPYTLTRADDYTTGTTLVIEQLRSQANELSLRRVRTDSTGVLSPLRSLFDRTGFQRDGRAAHTIDDPGFILVIQEGAEAPEENVGATILDSFVLRAVLSLDGPKLDLKVYRRDNPGPYLSIVDTYENDIGSVRADIRFFPRRKGVFANTSIDGRRAYSWISGNSGVAIFDRDFRVQPYGAPSDDWLWLTADAARNVREPRSSIAKKHFPMTPEVRGDTAENWMLRLPESAQLVGVVQVEGRRTGGPDNNDNGLIASADREGFVANQTFLQLWDLIRGAVEAIAQSDRRLQQEEAEAERAALWEAIRRKNQAAIDEVEASETIGSADKARIVAAIVQTQELVQVHEENARERERQLEVMSLLGIVAGFMTHEFGATLQELKDAQTELRKLAVSAPQFAEVEQALAQHVKSLTDFVTYSSGYIAGSKATPTEPYPARPRIQQMIRIFGQYASERHIHVELMIERDLLAPRVPVSLYNGIALNLYTNALKAVTGRAGQGRRVIAFRAWNDRQWHHLEVSDTGIGIPTALRERVFDPLFTTTDSRHDPLGSGMGLGLALVQRGVGAFGGRVDVVDAPPDFVTCVRVRLPLAWGER